VSESPDRWAAWVLERSHAGDADQKARSLRFLEPIRDRVLANARLRAGDTLLDVGTGDGLIAFGAAPLVGPNGRIIFSDISEALLEHCAEATRDIAVATRTDFVLAAADDLSVILDGSVDVVTTRSVLIYVDHKDSAFREFHRVLGPGGRLSIFEPINAYFRDDPNTFWGFDAREVADLVQKMWAYEGWTGELDQRDPMMNFDERDLLRFAEEAGFAEVHVDLVIDVEPGSWAEDWERLLGTAPNPNARTNAEVIAGALTPPEAERFEQYLRPLVDEGRGVKRSAFTYLRATK
jgi:arsenite methyltransferase